MKIPEGKSLILFDTHCLLCSRTIRFIIRHDPRRHFLFSGLTDPSGICRKQKLLIPAAEDSVILVQDDCYFTQSKAVFRIVGQLSFPARLFLIFSVLPRTWTDRLYRFIARNRFRWFERQQNCPVPFPEDQERFI